MRLILPGAVCLWLAAICAAFVWLMRYDAVPGSVGEVAHSWPSDTRLIRDETRLFLLVFAHPRCPCTRATLSELERILATAEADVATCVCFYRPKDSAPDWHDSDIWDQAERLPNVRIRLDLDGQEARRFGALTSGHVLLFARDGTVLFDGGVTPARGHGGPSQGGDALHALLCGEKAPVRRASVYGCQITDADCPLCEQETR